MENQLANGVENAPRRYLYKSMGATESQLNKPVVGVIYSHNQTSPAHSDINKILDCVCQGIISAGASAALCSVMERAKPLWAEFPANTVYPPAK